MPAWHCGLPEPEYGLVVKSYGRRMGCDFPADQFQCQQNPYHLRVVCGVPCEWTQLIAKGLSFLAVSEQNRSCACHPFDA